jgi:hypothetical protein
MAIWPSRYDVRGLPVQRKAWLAVRGRDSDGRRLRNKEPIHEQL